MNRRQALASFALVAFPGVKFATHTPLFGWEYSAASRKEFIKNNSRPFFSQQARLKGTGKGRVVILSKFLVQAMGKEFVPHKQGIGDCFVAGTLVTMADGGRKPIEKVKVGERVITHTGQSQSVTRTIRKPYDGPLTTIQTSASRIVCTPDHLFYTAGDWVAAKDLTLSDRLHVTPHRTEQATILDLLDYLPDSETQGEKLRVKGSSIWVNRFIPLDADLAFILGAYLAEGSGDCCRITFNLGHTETSFAESISKRIKKLFDFNCTTYQVPSKPSVLYVRVQSKAISTLITSLCNGNTYTKSLPAAIHTSPAEVKRAILLGWLEGDGSCTGRKQRQWDRRFTCSGTSVSVDLIDGMARLLSDLGIKFSRTSSKADDRVRRHDLHLYGNAALQLYPEMSDDVKAYHPNLESSTYQRFGTEVPIRKLSNVSRAKTTVYCLEVVNDNSFSAELISVHNCVGHAFATGADVLTAVQIYSQSKPEEWKAEAATEPLYGGCRVEIGGMRSNRDGATGYWAAEWVMKYGILLRQQYPGYDFTTYSPSMAKKLGREGCPDALEPLAKLHPVKTASLVRNWEECRDAVCNGYPVVMCSSLGFGMSSRYWKRDSQGFLRRRGSWSHAMLIIGIDDKSDRPGALVQNSWGDVFTGPTRHEQPAGSFWVDASTINSGMRQGDSHALSQYVGYPAIPDLDYNMW